MPRRKATQQESALEMADESFEDTQQLNNTQAQRAVNKLNPAEFERLVAEMVRYLLFSDKKKVGIKRADIIRNVLKDHGKAFPNVFEKSKLRLLEVFGFDVVSMTTEDGKSRGYILVNALDEELHAESLLEWNGESERMSLLLIIISMIFMNEGVVNENAMWYCLKKLGVEKRPHRLFGDPEKLINVDFVKQNYLERRKVNGPDGPMYQYGFGARSLAETSKRKILEFVTEVFGVESIDCWKIQYQQVLESEQNDDVTMAAA